MTNHENLVHLFETYLKENAKTILRNFLVDVFPHLDVQVSHFLLIGNIANPNTNLKFNDLKLVNRLFNSFIFTFFEDKKSFLFSKKLVIYKKVLLKSK